MSRFNQELKVIPPVAWAVAIVFYIGFVILAWLVLIPQDAGLSQWPSAGQAAFAVGIPIFFLIYVLLIGYVYADARRRGMRYVLWTLLAIFIPEAIGIILYFILRDPPMRSCPHCSATVQGAFAFCPACGISLKPSCPRCRRALEPGWMHCPKCGSGLRAA